MLRGASGEALYRYGVSQCSAEKLLPVTCLHVYLVIAVTSVRDAKPFSIDSCTLDGDAAAEACRAVAQMVLARTTLLLALPMLAL